MNLLEESGKPGLERQIKPELMQRIRKDTELLRSRGLIDYSLFLVEVDRHSQLRTSQDTGISSLVYDVSRQQFVMKVIEGTADKKDLGKYLRRPAHFSSTGDDGVDRETPRLSQLFRKAVFNTMDKIKLSQQSMARAEPSQQLVAALFRVTMSMVMSRGVRV